MIFFPKNPIKVEVSLSSRQVGGLKSVVEARRLEIIVDIPDGFDGDDPGPCLSEGQRSGPASPRPYADEHCPVRDDLCATLPVEIVLRRPGE